MGSHQVIITFDLDENKIQKNAEIEAGRQIAEQLTDSLFSRGYCATNVLKNYVTDILKEMLEPEKDKIIEEAIKQVIISLSRTKAVKEKLQEALNNE